jgi:aryl-alcohol dehydrogenase-like predicted oxidoreductase
MKKGLNRRDFIKTAGLTAAGLALSPQIQGSETGFDAKGMPTTKLGKTGVTIPRLILGAGSRFMAVEEDKGLEILEYALANGLYYWDTANTYTRGDQYSETRLGKILKSRRKEVFLATKVSERSADKAKQAIEDSLKRLQTDYVDLYQIHSVTTEDEVRQFGAKDGVLPVLKKYQGQGIIKHIGFTGHTSANAMKLAAELYDFDTMLIALNHQEKGKQPFEEHPVPYAASKGMGVLAMKLVRPRETVEGLDPKELIRYALTLKNITAAVIGIDNMDVLRTNIALLKTFEPLSPERMNELHGKLQPFYNNRHLPWMKPEYVDGSYWA